MVKIEDFAKGLNLKFVSEEYDSRNIESIEINRMGLQLTGFLEHFDSDRIQLIGQADWTYFNNLDKERRRKVAEDIMSYNIPCLVFTRNLEVFEEFVEFGEKYRIPILTTDQSTTIFVRSIINYLEKKLAPSVTLHGVLVDVAGIGILIFGKSGVGKSETALELVKRGHRFVADDAIEIKRVGSQLVGKAPELIKNFIEIRGIGILDIAMLYGIGSVRDSKVINMVIQFEAWDSGKVYDRLGIEEKTMDILGVDVSKLTIPVKPGRNLAVIVEAAARNHRMKYMGYNPAEELDKRIQGKIQVESKDVICD
ncbi:MAG: HPr(Ser) kinase/phosphatase [Firmicutes bacterium]|jgi:HPr kinase/phosphorylase|nr:HPr(Ser) kinase/phosphatase [Bacillota bacterium]